MAMRLLGFVVLAIAATTAHAHAQAQIVPADAAKGADAKTDIQGWNPFLSLTSTFSLTSNSNVIGQVDGYSALFGLGILGGADYVDGKHLFRSTLVINEGFARTPVVPEFVKTNDVAKLDGLYNYFVTPYLGLYGRLGLATSLLTGDDIRGQPTSWVDVTGTTPVPLNTNALKQHLADPFKPFTIAESVGGFADPLRRKEATISFRLGLGGRSTFANGTLALHDDPTTAAIEVIDLSDVHQFGAEAFAGASGKLDNDHLNYKAGLAVLFPFVNNDKYNRDTATLTRIAFEATAAYAVGKWFSIVYNLSIIRDPQLFPAGKEAVQVQNTVLLTFQLSLVKKKEKPKEKTKEQLELEAAKKRADDAEKRAAEAEKEVRELKEHAPTPPTPPTPTPTPPPAPPTPPAPTP